MNKPSAQFKHISIAHLQKILKVFENLKVSRSYSCKEFSLQRKRNQKNNKNEA